MNARPASFHPLARLLHWSMAILIVAMLFVGVGMASTVSPLRQTLLALHRPLGLALLVLVALRLAVRLRHRPPSLPTALPVWQRRAAGASQVLLYGLMCALPLVGWAMLSAGDYPVTLAPGLTLPPIMPRDAALYALLRRAHTALALLLFGIVLLHLAAALQHAWLRRDGVMASMAPWRRRGQSG